MNGTPARHAALALAVLLASCDSPPPRPIPSISEIVATCDPGLEQGACFRRFERAVLDSAHGARRAGDTLIITPARGAPVTFVSAPDSVEDGSRWLYLRHLTDIDAHVVYEQMYEGHAFALVHGTYGWSAVLDDAPLLSPDRTRLLTASHDTEAGYVANRARIFRITPDSLVLEWEIAPERWGPEDAHWVDDRTVRLQRVPAVGQADSATLAGPMVVRLVSGRWTTDSTASSPPARP